MTTAELLEALANLDPAALSDADLAALTTATATATDALEAEATNREEPEDAADGFEAEPTEWSKWADEFAAARRAFKRQWDAAQHPADPDQFQAAHDRYMAAAVRFADMWDDLGDAPDWSFREWGTWVAG